MSHTAAARNQRHLDEARGIFRLKASNGYVAQARQVVADTKSHGRSTPQLSARLDHERRKASFGQQRDSWSG